MKRKSFRHFLDEETAAADIAGVDSKLDTTRRTYKHLKKGKWCKIHKVYNCYTCLEEDYWD